MVFDHHYLSLGLYATLSFVRTLQILEDFLQCARELKATRQTHALPQEW